MNPEFRFEFTPLKLIAGLVGLASMWGVGLLMFHATQPPPEELHRARQMQQDAELRLQQREMMQRMQYEMRHQYDPEIMRQMYSPQ